MLEVNHLRIGIPNRKEIVKGISFQIGRGESLAIVGESGSGKTLTALSIPMLLQHPLQMTGGGIRFNGENLPGLPDERLRKLRGKEIGFVFQDPNKALNPLVKVGTQIGDVLAIHTDLSINERKDTVMDILDMCGLPDPRMCYESYPFQLSGGMKQRAVIAGAIACKPRLLIADEPTTALDACLRIQLMDMLMKGRQAWGMTVVFITHELDLAARYADSILVMQEGCLVEQGPTKQIIRTPRHPYTQMLVETFYE